VETNETQVQIVWSTLVGDLTGRESIMSYEIYWDAGSLGQDFVELHIAYSPFTYYLYLIEFPAVLPS
jgi:hypothetical protein